MQCLSVTYDHAPFASSNGLISEETESCDVAECANMAVSNERTYRLSTILDYVKATVLRELAYCLHITRATV